MTDMASFWSRFWERVDKVNGRVLAIVTTASLLLAIAALFFRFGVAGSDNKSTSSNRTDITNITNNYPVQLPSTPVAGPRFPDTGCATLRPISPPSNGFQSDVLVRSVDGPACFRSKTVVITKQPARVQILLRYRNSTDVTQSDVTVYFDLGKFSVVPRSIWLINDFYPMGVTDVTNQDLKDPGVDIGTYKPGANAFLLFEASMPAGSTLPCGNSIIGIMSTFGATEGKKVLGEATSQRVTLSRSC